MKYTYIRFLVALLFVGLLIAAVAFWGEKARTVQDGIDNGIDISTEFLIGFLPISEKGVEVSIQKSQNAKTATLVWDDSQFRVFHIVALDSELFNKGEASIVWQISSAIRFPTTSDDDFKKEDVSGFIPSPYALGDTGEFQLTIGKQYYLQLIGFTQNHKSLTVNKEFTFE